MLGLAVWLAARHALSFASGDKAVELAIPATSEELLIRMTEFSKSNPLETDASDLPATS